MSTAAERNDRLAREHPAEAYYREAAWPIRFVEQRRLAIVRRMAGDTAGRRVLEVGCGAGHLLRLFPEAQLVGVDVSPLALESAARNLAGYDATLVLADAETVEGQYDVVICSEVLEHVVQPTRVLDRINALLAPSGTAIITVPNEPLIRVAKTIFRPFMRVEWGGGEHHLHHWSPRNFEALLKRFLLVEERAFAPSPLMRIRCCYRCRRL
jgi:2-polyprenyl-3-methyl-5-hydroxy-6-metoxy-1,4-benzoquinol methylase